MEIEEKTEKAISKAMYHIAAGSMIFLESENPEISKILAKRAGKAWKVISVKNDKWDIAALLLKSNGFFKGIILGKIPRDRVLIAEVSMISEKNMKKIRYFYDENNLKSVIIIAKDKSVMEKFPDAVKSRIGNRIIKEGK